MNGLKMTHSGTSHDLGLSSASPQVPPLETAPTDREGSKTANPSLSTQASRATYDPTSSLERAIESPVDGAREAPPTGQATTTAAQNLPFLGGFSGPEDARASWVVSRPWRPVRVRAGDVSKLGGLHEWCARTTSGPSRRNRPDGSTVTMILWRVRLQM